MKYILEYTESVLIILRLFQFDSVACVTDSASAAELSTFGSYVDCIGSDWVTKTGPKPFTDQTKRCLETKIAGLQITSSNVFGPVANSSKHLTLDSQPRNGKVYLPSANSMCCDNQSIMQAILRLFWTMKQIKIEFTNRQKDGCVTPSTSS